MVACLPYLPHKMIHGNFARAEGMSEEKLESRQQNLVKTFENCRTITCISRVRQSHRLANGLFFPRLTPETMHGNFTSAEGANE